LGVSQQGKLKNAIKQNWKQIHVENLLQKRKFREKQAKVVSFPVFFWFIAFWSSKTP
jgi:hypothetical protein